MHSAPDLPLGVASSPALHCRHPQPGSRGKAGWPLFGLPWAAQVAPQRCLPNTRSMPHLLLWSSSIVFCAALQLHQLDTPPAGMKPPIRTDNGGGSRRHPNVSATPAATRTTVYTCHRSRVKARPAGWQTGRRLALECSPAGLHVCSARHFTRRTVRFGYTSWFRISCCIRLPRSVARGFLRRAGRPQLSSHAACATAACAPRSCS